MEPLTNPQKLIYNMEKYAGGAIAVICGSVLFEGKKDTVQLTAAANEIFRLNDALRTRICEVDGQVRQKIPAYEESYINVLRFDSEVQFHAYAEEYAKVPVSLTGSLCELQVIFTDKHYGLLAKCHHLIGDAWTLTLIASQLAAILSGNTPPAFPYADYVKSEAAYIQSPRYSKDRTFFTEQFKTCDEVTYLSEKSGDSYVAQRTTFHISAEQTAQIRSYAKQCGASPFALFFTAFSIYFSRVKMNTERFYIGTPILNRCNFKEKNTMGMFINTVPVLVNVDYSKSFAENLSAMKASIFSILRHQKFHYNNLLTAIRQEYGFTEKLYDVILSYQNAAVAGAASKVETTWYHSGSQVESLQIHIDDRDGGGAFRIHLDYRTDKFTLHEIEQMYTHILNLLMDAIYNDYKKPSELELLSADEKQQLLQTFNDTTADYPRDKCVHQIFEEHALKNPNQPALWFSDRCFTYKELNGLANSVAWKLKEQGVKRGDIVAILAKRSYELVVAMLAILKAGAAYLIIDSNYPNERIKSIVLDSNCKLVLTYGVNFTGSNGLKLEKNIATCDQNPPNVNDAYDVCAVIYTSGSTGHPKGSLLCHQGLVNHAYANSMFTSGSCIIGFTIQTFDAFFVDTIGAMMRGIPTILATEAQQFQQFEFEKLIKDHEKCNLFITPTRFKLFLDNKIDDHFYEKINNIYIGGEVFPQEFASILAKNINVFNAYGPAECSMWVTESHVKDADITIGHPIANTQIYIVDKHMNPVPIGITGELCIAGDGVAAGYLNRPELTEEKFIPNPFGAGRLYKTGDLAYWRRDGNIVYVGRNDFQVKIRGVRIELEEIASIINSVEGISQSVIVVRKDDTGRQLICAFYTEVVPVELETIKAAIRKKLPQYMMPHIFTKLDSLPMTTTGKINRKALPDIELTAIISDVEYVSPGTREESALAAAVAEVLRLERPSMLDNFFALGGDSLKAIELTTVLERQGYCVETKEIFAADTLDKLATRLKPAEKTTETEVPLGDIPATDAQMRVYTAQSISGGTAYNVPYALKVKNLDPERLQFAIKELIVRHEILRTRFENREGVIVQVVDDMAACTVDALPSDDLAAFVQPFDLAAAPLLRAAYHNDTVMLDMHHIITDGGSMPVFLRELNELYMGRELNDRPVQYRSFAVRQEDHNEAEAYWLSVFNDEPPVLELNTDYPRGSRQTFSGSAHYEMISAGLHAEICAKCRQLEVTPYVFYMGAFHVLLSKFGGGEDIVVGTPASGRSGKFLNTLGMFVNTLALRSRPKGEKPVSEFLCEVKEAAVGALENQAYPYGELIKKLGLQGGNRNPLFDVVFAYQSKEMAEITFGDEPAELLPIPITASKYDFTFNVIPGNNDVVLMVEYCTDLYKERTIMRLIEGYKLLLTQMLDESKPIKDLTAMTDQEQQTLLCDFNDNNVDYPREKCVHQLFEEQAEKEPNQTAVIACDRTLTYRELNEEANRIAHSLIKRGVKPGDIIAFALPRDSHLIPTIFGILKAGAAYLPIDPDYPQDRIDHMLKDSAAQHFLTKKDMVQLLETDFTVNPGVYIPAEAKYCIIYTSGSTGNPKGCILTHRGVCNFCVNNNVIHYFKRKGLSPIGISLNNVTFDYFIAENIVLLTHGAVTVLCDEDQSILPVHFWSLCAAHKVNLIQTTPTKYRIMLESPECAYLKNIALLVTSGEPLTNELLESLRSYTSAEIFNPLGPSETTVWSPNGEGIGDTDIHIGKPLTNTQVFIVDKYLKPVPIGVTGELCIAGDGVGAGYLNRPELTAEKFIPNPFGKGKLYKTGDLAYWREDGNIGYVGRNDFQVKIRGLRVELGEIESAITGVEGVNQSVVAVRKDDTGRQLICAFYTEAVPVKLEIIKTALRDKLPRYMMPHIFTRLNNLPVTTSGKVNRKLLPDVDLNAVPSSADFVPTEGQREICGDLQKDKFGLSEQEYRTLQENINTVINAAASVKHYGSYRYFYEVNVETVQRLIDFTRSIGARLIHISTLSVSGNSFGDDFSGYVSETEKYFNESNLYIGQPLENVYARSKFEAEKAVFDAMLHGLKANIMRMGNLTNRYSDGVFQINHDTNAFASRIKGVLELGIVPDYLLTENMYTEFTPIDEAAAAIMILTRHFTEDRTVFHINSTKVVYLDRLLGLFQELGYRLKVVSGDDFTIALSETAKRAGMEHIFETFINDLDVDDHLVYDSNIHIENTFTEEYLRRLGFTWSEIGSEYLRKYVEYFRKIGYWER